MSTFRLFKVAVLFAAAMYFEGCCIWDDSKPTTAYPADAVSGACAPAADSVAGSTHATTTDAYGSTPAGGAVATEAIGAQPGDAVDGSKNSTTTAASASSVTEGGDAGGNKADQPGHKEVAGDGAGKPADAQGGDADKADQPGPTEVAGNGSDYCTYVEVGSDDESTYSTGAFNERVPVDVEGPLIGNLAFDSVIDEECADSPSPVACEADAPACAESAATFDESATEDSDFPSDTLHA